VAERLVALADPVIARLGCLLDAHSECVRLQGAQAMLDRVRIEDDQKTSVSMTELIEALHKRPG
jgi:hypothetical protein